MESLGKHILVEYYDCDRDILNLPHFVEEQMLKAAEVIGATILNSTTH
jgi:spermidine synthase